LGRFISAKNWGGFMRGLFRPRIPQGAKKRGTQLILDTR